MPNMATNQAITAPYVMYSGHVYGLTNPGNMAMSVEPYLARGPGLHNTVYRTQLVAPNRDSSAGMTMRGVSVSVSALMYCLPGPESSERLGPGAKPGRGAVPDSASGISWSVGSPGTELEFAL